MDYMSTIFNYLPIYPSISFSHCLATSRGTARPKWAATTPSPSRAAWGCWRRSSGNGWGRRRSFACTGGHSWEFMDIFGEKMTVIMELDGDIWYEYEHDCTNGYKWWFRLRKGGVKHDKTNHKCGYNEIHNQRYYQMFRNPWCMEFIVKNQCTPSKMWFWPRHYSLYYWWALQWRFNNRVGFGRFPRMVVPPVIIHFDGNFHYKPSIFGISSFLDPRI